MRGFRKIACSAAVAAALIVVAASSADARGFGFGGRGFHGGGWRGPGFGVTSWALGFVPGWNFGRWGLSGTRYGSYGYPYGAPYNPYLGNHAWYGAYSGYPVLDTGYPQYTPVENPGYYPLDSIRRIQGPYEYYCANPEGYYPDVPDCDDWQQIYTGPGGTTEE